MARFTAATVAQVPFYALGDNGRPVRDAAGKLVVTHVMFRAVCRYLPGLDEMWEMLEHPALFADEARAQRFCDRVNAPGSVPRFSAWMFRGHPCSPMGATEVAAYCPL